jgi:hypothetical protein
MSATGESGVRCPAITRSGQPCRARATANGWCVAHTPAAAEWRAKGGRATRRSERAARLLPARLQPVAALLDTALREVYEGTLEPKQATAMAALAGALVRVVTAGEVEERLRAIEAALADPRGGMGA